MTDTQKHRLGQFHSLENGWKMYKEGELSSGVCLDVKMHFDHQLYQVHEILLYHPWTICPRHPTQYLVDLQGVQFLLARGATSINTDNCGGQVK